MSEILDGNSKGTRQAEIRQLEQAFSINQQILRLQVTMEYFMSMALLDTIKKLVQVFLEKSNS